MAANKHLGFRLNGLLLVSRGFVLILNKCDPTLFSLVTPTYTILMLIYVDDIIVIDSSPIQVQNLVTEFNSEFA